MNIRNRYCTAKVGTWCGRSWCAPCLTGARLSAQEKKEPKPKKRDYIDVDIEEIEITVLIQESPMKPLTLWQKMRRILTNLIGV